MVAVHFGVQQGEWCKMSCGKAAASASGFAAEPRSILIPRHKGDYGGRGAA